MLNYREIEQRGRIQSALNKKVKSHQADDNARLAEYWKRRAERTGDVGDIERAERFAALMKRGD